MAFNYTIEARIKNKKTKEIVRIGLAKWDKCYSLNGVIQDVIKNQYPSSVKKIVGTDFVRCETWIIDKIIEELSSRLSDENDSAWAFSYCGRDEVRYLTCNAIAKMCAAQSLFKVSEKQPLDDTAFTAKLLGVDKGLIEELCKNSKCYKVSIEFNNKNWATVEA